MKKLRAKPGVTIENCTFTSVPTEQPVAIEALAKAVQANAEAVSKLAQYLNSGTPAIVINSGAK